MRLGYVVLYVNDVESCSDFWTHKVGMEIQSTAAVNDFQVVRVGFQGRETSIELVPLELMKDNPDGLDLATPSMCFYVQDIESEHQRLQRNGVQVSEISVFFDQSNFAFSDNENRWFAVSVSKQ